MKIIRNLKTVRDVLETETDEVSGELSITIANRTGTPEAKSTVFLMNKDIAQIFIKTLFDAMKLDDPQEELPKYRIEP